jgi:TolB-like protein
VNDRVLTLGHDLGRQGNDFVDDTHAAREYNLVEVNSSDEADDPIEWQSVMRQLIFTCVLILMLGSVVRADPTTQPACDVYLTPFTALGGDNSLDWAGKGVEQNLLSDLANAKFHPLAADKATDAQAEAKSAGAKFLITGTYQTIELQVRFNGQVIDLASGNVIGGLSATGSPRDLFSLEDALSAQALAALKPTAVAANKKPAAPLPAALAPAAVAQVVNPPAVIAPGGASSYQGSALQAYVDSNRTPSTDYAQQVQDAQDRDTNGSIYGSSFGFGGYGAGYASFGSAYGESAFGYPGLGFGFGGRGYGVFYSVQSGGSFGGFGIGHSSGRGFGYHVHGEW